MKRRGIVLAGGAGTRLHPITMAVSKQLVPVYDKPMIYYPLATLMAAKIREVLVITTPEDQAQFQRLLGDGSQWGMQVEYAAQPKPEGLAQAFHIGADFVAGGPSALVLGDNIFYGHGLERDLLAASEQCEGATVFGYWVADPERYGVAVFGDDGMLVDIEEKPEHPQSHYAISGLYFYDDTVVDRAKALKPSKRGELEITDLNRSYLRDKKLELTRLGRGVAWLDTGQPAALLQASNFVQTIQERQGLRIACLEEIAYGHGWIDDQKLLEAADALGKTSYGEYLRALVDR